MRLSISKVGSEGVLRELAVEGSSLDLDLALEDEGAGELDLLEQADLELVLRVVLILLNKLSMDLSVEQRRDFTPEGTDGSGLDFTSLGLFFETFVGVLVGLILLAFDALVAFESFNLLALFLFATDLLLELFTLLLILLDFLSRDLAASGSSQVTTCFDNDGSFTEFLLKLLFTNGSIVVDPEGALLLDFLLLALGLVASTFKLLSFLLGHSPIDSTLSMVNPVKSSAANSKGSSLILTIGKGTGGASSLSATELQGLESSEDSHSSGDAPLETSSTSWSI